MLIDDLTIKTIKDIVSENFQTASVFEKYSLDFCCRGGKTITEACAEKGVSADEVIEDLAELTAVQRINADQFTEWDVETLIEYILTKHHAYVNRMIPVLYTHTQKVSSVHGINHPEVIAIAKHFESVGMELQHHMIKEENILFPYIKNMAAAHRTKKNIAASPFGTVQNPIRMMKNEHRNAGDELYAIRELSNGYAPPADACTTYRVLYQELQEFETDLHQHVHLENNILFPKAIALEQELLTEK